MKRIRLFIILIAFAGLAFITCTKINQTRKVATLLELTNPYHYIWADKEINDTLYVS